MKFQYQFLRPYDNLLVSDQDVIEYELIFNTKSDGMPNKDVHFWGTIVANPCFLFVKVR